MKTNSKLEKIHRKTSQAASFSNAFNTSVLCYVINFGFIAFLRLLTMLFFIFLGFFSGVSRGISKNEKQQEPNEG